MIKDLYGSNGYVFADASRRADVPPRARRAGPDLQGQRGRAVPHRRHQHPHQGRQPPHPPLDRPQPAVDAAGRHRRHPPVPLQRAAAEGFGPVQHRSHQGRGAEGRLLASRFGRSRRAQPPQEARRARPTATAATARLVPRPKPRQPAAARTAPPRQTAGRAGAAGAEPRLRLWRTRRQSGRASAQPYTVSQAAPHRAVQRRNPTRSSPPTPRRSTRGRSTPHSNPMRAPAAQQPYAAPQQPYAAGQQSAPQPYTAPGGGPGYTPPAQPYVAQQNPPPPGQYLRRPGAPPSDFLGNAPTPQPTVDVIVSSRSANRQVHVRRRRQLECRSGRLDRARRAELRLAPLPTSWEDFRSGRAFRGAGQKFRIEAAPGTQVSRYMFNFAEPYLFDTPVSFGLSGYYFNRFYRDWTEQRAGGRTSLGYQFTPDLSGNCRSAGRRHFASHQPRVTRDVPDLDAVIGHTQLYSFKAQIAYDTRDSTFLPTEGMYLSSRFRVCVGHVPVPAVTLLDFQQALPAPRAARRHGPAHAQLYTQFGISGNDTPIYERFFAGGFGTLRGYPVPRCVAADRSRSKWAVACRTSIRSSTCSRSRPTTCSRAWSFVDFGTVEYNAARSLGQLPRRPGFRLAGHDPDDQPGADRAGLRLPRAIGPDRHSPDLQLLRGRGPLSAASSSSPTRQLASARLTPGARHRRSRQRRGGSSLFDYQMYE